MNRERRNLKMSNEKIRNERKTEINAENGSGSSDGFCVVHFKVEGRYDVRIPRAELEEMKKAASEKWSEADFGELEDADAEIVYVQSPNGEYLYEA